MDYAELYENVAREIPISEVFAIQVETWRHSSRLQITQWTIYVESEISSGPFYRGLTAEAAYQIFMAARVTPEVLEVVSAAVSGKPKLTREAVSAAVELIVDARSDLTPEYVANAAHVLTDQLGMELEISESLIFWASRRSRSEANAVYEHWLNGCVAGKTAAELNTTPDAV
jgi:hypothetical protein